MRNSGGGDGSSSSYVVIDPEANSGSGVGSHSPMHGQQQQQQAHHSQQQQQQQQQQQLPVLLLDPASEFTRIKTLTNRAQLIASMGDQRLASLRSPALLQLLEDVESADPADPLVKDTDGQQLHAAGHSALLAASAALSVPGASLQEQLAAVLALYLKALQQLAAIVAVPAQVLDQLQSQEQAAMTDSHSAATMAIQSSTCVNSGSGAGKHRQLNFVSCLSVQGGGLTRGVERESVWGTRRDACTCQPLDR